MNARADAAPWQKVYDELGVTTPDFDDRPLGAHIEEHARLRPDCVALQYQDREISYLELNLQANRLANALAGLGVEKNDIVGLHMPNLPNYAVALTALAKLGCAGSGVSPLLAPSELVHQVRDAGLSVLISYDALSPVLTRAAVDLPTCLRHIIQVSADDYLGGKVREREQLAGRTTLDYLDLLAHGGDDFQQRDTHWNDRFMVQYTGGTTGMPKGAELSIRNLLHNPRQSNACEPWEMGSEVFASAFPYFHAGGLGVLVAGLVFGARNIVVTDARDIEELCHQMLRTPPTRMAAVPTLYMMLVNSADSAGVDFSNLKTAVSGAAPLPMEDRLRIEQLLGANKLNDVLGMTETGPVHVGNPPQRLKPGTVGIPVPGADTRIVDLETGSEEMPAGEPGEIITSGPQVMKSYLNLPDETARALRQWRGKTWMYTGDVGFMDEEGYITLCDRAKDMLIVGGFKVFSVEVEDKLKALDCIAETAVIGTPDHERPGNDVVNLYVELTPQARGRDEDSLRETINAFCRDNLSPYKVPKNIFFIDRIPLTVIGKIDKKVLRTRG